MVLGRPDDRAPHVLSWLLGPSVDCLSVRLPRVRRLGGTRGGARPGWAPRARDRDEVYGGDFRERAGTLRIETSLLTPVRARWANAIAERVIGTPRRECLDHLIVLNKRQLRTVLREYVAYCNADRPHRSLGLQRPRPAARPDTGSVCARPILGGLHHAYEHAA